MRVTLDAELQQSVYNIMNDAENGNLTIGSCVVMRPNGELLLIVSLPSFVLNRFRTDEMTRILQTGTGSAENKAIKACSMPFEIFSPVMKKVYGTEDAIHLYSRILDVIN